MLRLIDADALMIELNNTKYAWQDYDAVEDALRNIPTIEAEPVVRCRDCKHWLKDVPGCTDFVGRCELANYMVGATGYCVYGDRRADDGN